MLQTDIRRMTGHANLNTCCACGGTWLYNAKTWLCAYCRYSHSSTAHISALNYEPTTEAALEAKIKRSHDVHTS